MITQRALDLRKQYKDAPQRNTEPIKKLMREREVKDWNDFPPETKEKYLEIAKCFPNLQVYAFGSRIKGYYADEGDNVAIEARAMAGMKKTCSDYDFFLLENVKETTHIPPMSDRLMCGSIGERHILVPIFRA